MKVAWGLTGSGDLMPETIKAMKEITQSDPNITTYIFLSKAAEKVVKWYGLLKDLKAISDKIHLEVDANTTEPFYYFPGALQVGKFDFLMICPATGNTVAKIVYGIADTIVTNSVAQAAKANTPVYILPVDHVEGKQTTTLPSGAKLELEMREIDLENVSRLAKMRSINVFYSVDEIEHIFKKHNERSRVK